MGLSGIGPAAAALHSNRYCFLVRVMDLYFCLYLKRLWLCKTSYIFYLFFKHLCIQSLLKRKRCKSQKLKESKKQSATTGRNKKQATVVVRDGSDEKVEDPSTSNAAGASDTNQTSVKPAAGTGKGKSTFSPASSAIRSLLASKVTGVKVGVLFVQLKLFC